MPLWANWLSRNPLKVEIVGPSPTGSTNVMCVDDRPVVGSHFILGVWRNWQYARVLKTLGQNDRVGSTPTTPTKVRVDSNPTSGTVLSVQTLFFSAKSAIFIYI